MPMDYVGYICDECQSEFIEYLRYCKAKQPTWHGVYHFFESFMLDEKGKYSNINGFSAKDFFDKFRIA